MTTNSENTKVYQPVEVTEGLKTEYEALRITEREAQAILANTTTRIFLKGYTPPTSQE